MSKAEIASWVSTSARNVRDDSDGEDFIESSAESEPYSNEHWDRFLDLARDAVLSNSTRRRLFFLQERGQAVATRGELDEDQVKDLLGVLVPTYSRYVDTGSRTAVLQLAQTLLKNPASDADEKAEFLLERLNIIVSRADFLDHSPAADRFNLLTWCTMIYEILAVSEDDPSSLDSWRSNVRLLSQLLNSILWDQNIRGSIHQATLVRTRRAIRNHPNNIPMLLKYLLEISTTDPISLADLIGVVLDVSVRLRKPSTTVDNSVAIIEKFKPSILLLIKTLIAAKKEGAKHAMVSLRGFIENSVEESDVEHVLLFDITVALEKPTEHSSSAVASFFHAYSRDVSERTFSKLQLPLVAGLKSTDPIIRQNTSVTLSHLSSQTAGKIGVNLITSEVLAVLKAGKTTGPDHRIALFTVLAGLTPTSTSSPLIVDTIIPLLIKETNEPVLAAIERAASRHMVWLARQGITLSPATASLVSREMVSLKIPSRKALARLVGLIFWPEPHENLNPEAIGFLESLGRTVGSSLQSYLKTVSGAPLNAPAGPCEAFIAVAIVLKWSQLDCFRDIAQGPLVQGLVASSAKPSFILSEKVYGKLSTIADDIWLIRAVEGLVVRFADVLTTSDGLRPVVGAVYMHTITRSTHRESQKEALRSLTWLNCHEPRLPNLIVRESLPSILPEDYTNSNSTTTGITGIQGILKALSTFAESVDPKARRDILKEWIVLAHHPAATQDPRQAWISMVQGGGQDPHVVIVEHLDYVLAQTLDTLGSTSVTVLRSAARLAATTLAFVAPEVVVRRLVDRIGVDLDPAELKNLGELEYAIFSQEDHQVVVDVLAQKRSDVTLQAATSKGKHQSIEQWEEQLRKSIQAKKSAMNAASLSKEDRALVNQQLETEKGIRNRMKALVARLREGLAIIDSLVIANVDAFRGYISSTATMLLEGVLPHSLPLLGSEAFQTYLGLGRCCSIRLSGASEWVGVATARSLGISAVPPEMAEEPLQQLILRLLYRLRSISESAPLDAASYAYTSPLLRLLIRKGGAGTADPEAITEQIALSLNIIDFHCSSCNDPTYPRQEMTGTLILAMSKYPALAKDASSTLVALGQAISSNATLADMTPFAKGAIASESHVRSACLQAMQPFDLTDEDWSPELWLACHDDDEQNGRLATNIWEENGFEVPEHFIDPLLAFAEPAQAFGRRSLPSSAASAVEVHPHKASLLLRSLRALFKERSQPSGPKFDEFGIEIDPKSDQVDDAQVRLAVAETFGALAIFFPQDDVVPFFKFLVIEGALNDGDAEVRKAVLEAGITVVNTKGAKSIQGLITLFESYLKKGSSAEDRVKEAVVILLGRVAGHLPKGDPRIKSVLDRLILALRTPSETVQTAVAACLPQLIVRIKGDVPRLLGRLLSELVESPKYGERRGAAYGVAGMVKGLGLSSLQKYDILSKISTAMDDKKYFESRQGALFAIETLSLMLGRIFEPYVIELLPMLLTTFGDSTTDVREATEDACKVVMANMSGHGVRLILPKLLEGLDEKQWRSKKGSIELLGTMAFCAPKQLSVSLPAVVPQLTEVLKDSHAQVRQAAARSLKQFSEVISNPEIRSLVPLLQRALVDPDKTPDALRSLLETTFIHFVDTPSLAIVIPILENGLRSRGSDTKRMAVQIVGNLASLTDAKDFTPHLNTLLPLIHQVLVDPVPEVRAAAAKSLGTLVERLGEDSFPELVPGLFRTLRSESSAIDRQGAAQGLSEVLSGLGMERMESVLPQIIDNARSPRPFVREGFMSLLVYLPVTFGQRFAPYLSRIVQPILDGLSDVEELVRSASMRAGRIMINQFSSRATDLLLPQLQRGVFDESWRIRLSSLTLIGELLYKLTGISGKIGTDDEGEDDIANIGDVTRRQLTEVLGKDRRDTVLSVLFTSRQDSVSAVRLASSHIWKVIVSNTPRTVRDVLGALLALIVELLVTTTQSTQDTASATMTELCRKFGERILGDVVMFLREAAQSSFPQTREGACLAISEVVENSAEETVAEFESQIIIMVRTLLVDNSPQVRVAAASAFDVLQKHIGPKAIDQTIPTLLNTLRQAGPGADTALQALKEVMTVRASSVFPILIPTLTALPISAFNAQALGQLVTVAGAALAKRLNQILEALASSAETESDEDILVAVEESTERLLESVSDEEALDNLMEILSAWAKDSSPLRRKSAMHIFEVFCQVTDLDFSDYRVQWIERLVLSLDDGQLPVVDATVKALEAFVKAIDKDELDALIIPMRRTIDITGAPGRPPLGFSIQGLASIVPIVLAGLTGGTSDQRENAALSISDLVQRTESPSMKPYTTQLTGALIRVITQATTLPPAVKSAILLALTTMLDSIPSFVKPFFPQLQRTFCKTLVDPSSASVRGHAAEALGALFKSQPRVDPLVTELIGTARSSQDERVAASVYQGLAQAVGSAKEHVGSASRRALADLIEESFSAESYDDTLCTAIAKLFASLAFDVDTIKDIVMNHLVFGSPPNALTARILAEVTTATPKVFYDLRCVVPMVRQVIACVGTDDTAISRPGREARETLKTQSPWVDDSNVQSAL